MPTEPRWTAARAGLILACMQRVARKSAATFALLCTGMGCSPCSTGPARAGGTLADLADATLSVDRMSRADLVTLYYDDDRACFSPFGPALVVTADGAPLPLIDVGRYTHLPATRLTPETSQCRFPRWIHLHDGTSARRIEVRDASGVVTLDGDETTFRAAVAP